MIPTVLRLLYDLLSMKNDINVPLKSNKLKTSLNLKENSRDEIHKPRPRHPVPAKI